MSSHIEASHVNPPSGEAESNMHQNMQNEDETEVGVEIDEVKPKWSSARKSGTKSKKAVTGFEEYYCDAPLTPKEYEEEITQLYAPHIPFDERIEECLKRYRNRRRLNSARLLLFDKYLCLGGIDATPRQFQGTRDIVDEILEDASNDYIRDMNADAVVSRGGGADPRFYNSNDTEGWVVDFTGVVSAYLSDYLPSLVGNEWSTIKEGIEVVLNFLKYVDYHSVCPEYSEDLKCAQKVCEQANIELPGITHVTTIAPGEWNIAASTLYYRHDKQYGPRENYENELLNALPPTPEQAKCNFLATLFAWLERERLKPIVRDITQISAIGTATVVFEVVDIPDSSYNGRATQKWAGRLLPIEEQLGFYGGVRAASGKRNSFKPCGVIRLKPTAIEDCMQRDPNRAKPIWVNDTEDFFLEVELLQYLSVGMKMDLTICRLSCGINFIKKIWRVYPSFHTYLLQTLMLDYRDPGPLLEPKDWPSDDDSSVVAESIDLDWRYSDIAEEPCEDNNTD